MASSGLRDVARGTKTTEKGTGKPEACPDGRSEVLKMPPELLLMALEF